MFLRFMPRFSSSTLISLVYASSFSTFFFRFSLRIIFFSLSLSLYPSLVLARFRCRPCGIFFIRSFAYWRWWRRLFCVSQPITGMLSPVPTQTQTHEHSRATTNIISSLYFDGIRSWDDVQRSIWRGKHKTGGRGREREREGARKKNNVRNFRRRSWSWCG